MTTNPPDTEPNTPRSLGQRIGCVAIIVVLAIGIGLVGYEFMRVNRLVTNYQHRFATWTQVDASAIDQTEVIAEPTFFFASTITLHGSTAEVAMLGGDATLHGQYQGDVHFLGRYFDLAPTPRSWAISSFRAAATSPFVEGSRAAWRALGTDSLAMPIAKPKPHALMHRSLYEEAPKGP